MKKNLLALVGLAAVAVAAPALAADLFVKAPPPVYSWTGWYAGVNVGYSWGNGKSLYYDPNLSSFGTPPPSVSNPLSQKIDGIIGGAQIGYNWQVNPTWVLGLEADIQGSGERGSAGFNDPYSSGVACDVFCSSVYGTMKDSINWFGTLRGRIGYLYNPTTLFYGTGGLAFGGIGVSGTITDGCFSGAPHACAPGSWGFSKTQTNAGWTLGGGVEAVVSGHPDWTWKAEYLYLNLGSVSGTGFEAGGDFGTLPYTFSSKVTDNILRVGLNYHFH